MIPVRFIRRIGPALLQRVLEVPELPDKGTILEFGTGDPLVQTVIMRPRDGDPAPGVYPAVLVTIFTAPEPEERLAKAKAGGWQEVGGA